MITVARVSLPEYWLLLISKKASIIPMMSFTRDTASVHKLEPKKKNRRILISEKHVYSVRERGSLKEKIQVLPARVEAMTFHKATGDTWALRPLRFM